MTFDQWRGGAPPPTWPPTCTDGNQLVGHAGLVLGDRAQCIAWGGWSYNVQCSVLDRTLPLENEIRMHDVAGLDTRPYVRSNCMPPGLSYLTIVTINYVTTLKASNADGKFRARTSQWAMSVNCIGSNSNCQQAQDAATICLLPPATSVHSRMVPDGFLANDDDSTERDETVPPPVLCSGIKCPSGPHDRFVCCGQSNAKQVCMNATVGANETCCWTIAASDGAKVCHRGEKCCAGQSFGSSSRCCPSNSTCQFHVGGDPTCGLPLKSDDTPAQSAGTISTLQTTVNAQGWSIHTDKTIRAVASGLCLTSTGSPLPGHGALPRSPFALNLLSTQPRRGYRLDFVQGVYARMICTSTFAPTALIACVSALRLPLLLILLCRRNQH
jgi:hypothetical protein